MTQKKKKRYVEPSNYSGQHLLHSKKLINEIVSHAKLNIHDTVLDLGAGKGAITAILSQKAKKVIAVENDRKFVEVLKEKFGHYPNTKIIHQDILKIHLPKEPFVVVSNIPYSITTPILKMLFNNPTRYFQRGIIVVEKGAAKRFTSKFVKDPHVIAWRMWFDIRYVKEIKRNHFSPPPRVDSAVILIKRKEKPIIPITDYLTFLGMADYLLKNPQSPIGIALRGIFTPAQIKQLKRNLRIKEEVSVATLSEQQWGFIFETMVKYVPKFRWPKIKKAHH